MATYDDDADWTWELVVATLDRALPTVSVRPGLARVTVPTEDGLTRDVHLVMTVDDFEDMTVVDGDDLGFLVDRVVEALRAMPPHRHYLVYWQFSLAASRTMPPSAEELDRAREAGRYRP